MQSTIARRIERELGMAGLVDALASKLSASDLRSILMEVFRDRSAGVKEAEIRAQALRDPLMAPSAVSARDLIAFDSVAFQVASEFAALDLSPVCPFSAAATLGGTSQNNVVTAIRNAEALGDPTISLALEAVRRRPAAALVRLCASHRVIRLQPFDVPGYSPHFRVFALVTAGRDTGSLRFETANLVDHVRIYLRIFRLLTDVGFAFRNPLVEFADMLAIEETLDAAGVTREEIRKSVRAHRLGGSERFLRERGVVALPDAHHPHLEADVIASLRDEFPEAEFRVNQRRLEGLGYYCSFTLRISPQAPDGNRYPIVDGGFTDWTARRLENRKERLLISGIGTEFVCKTYRRSASSAGSA
ncbi:MAG TPA: hypothetical protein VKU01_37060 [Bryobacteraceae bacterium]|nr:hypothetical protein [Bryobacteraceae bacterium]